MEKLKEFYKEHSEIIRYFAFGLITTVVSLSVFATVMVVAELVFDADAEGKKCLKYLIWISVANVLKWCSGVLTAFFTNKKWVFTNADKSVNVWKQLLVFANGRVLTLVASLVLEYLLETLFEEIITQDITVVGFTVTASAIGTTLALVIYSVIEVVANYFFSKWVVFRKKQ